MKSSHNKHIYIDRYSKNLNLKNDVDDIPFSLLSNQMLVHFFLLLVKLPRRLDTHYHIFLTCFPSEPSFLSREERATTTREHPRGVASFATFLWLALLAFAGEKIASESCWWSGSGRSSTKRATEALAPLYKRSCQKLERATSSQARKQEATSKKLHCELRTPYIRRLSNQSRTN